MTSDSFQRLWNSQVGYVLMNEEVEPSNKCISRPSVIAECLYLPYKAVMQVHTFWDTREDIEKSRHMIP